LDYFNLITGLATLAGAVCQIADLFSGHREARKGIFYGISGVFLGGLIVTFFSPLTHISIDLSTFSKFNLLIAALLLIIFCIFLAAAFTSDHNKRAEIISLLEAASVIFFIVLILGGLLEYASDDEARKLRNKLTIDELIGVSVINLEKGNYERAIELLDAAKEQLPSGDIRRSVIDSKIRYIKNNQINNNVSGK
jgi:hypothetical protein